MTNLNATAFRTALTACAALLLLMQFNNCGTYSSSGNESQSSGMEVTCLNDACITPTADNLSVTVNLGGGSEYRVPGNLTEWNLGGDCNEGGFPFNLIVWELYLNGQKVRDSNMTGMAGGSNVNSRCVNGRFLLYLNMSAIAGDQVNRTGLNAGGTRAQYDLYVEIYGQDTMNGAPQRNQTTGRTHISLLPI